MPTTSAPFPVPYRYDGLTRRPLLSVCRSKTRLAECIGHKSRNRLTPAGGSLCVGGFAYFFPVNIFDDIRFDLFYHTKSAVSIILTRFFPKFRRFSSYDPEEIEAVGSV